jgi:hypothetical protein
MPASRRVGNIKRLQLTMALRAIAAESLIRYAAVPRSHWARESTMSSDGSPGELSSPRTIGDWFRVVALAIGFVALGWFFLTRYSGPGRFEPHRRLVRDFFRAAQAQDTVRLRTLASSAQPIQWALGTAADSPWLLPPPDSALDIQGANRSGTTEEVVVWVAGVCSKQPYFVLVSGNSRDRRIEAVRTDCVGPSPGTDSPRP